jgi:hypothetical protein
MVKPTVDWPRATNPVPPKEELASMCTVQQLLQMRSEVEQQITLLLQDFQKRTGSSIVEVELKTCAQTTFGQKIGQQIVSGVRIRVEI